jgi:hypothetical protein
MLLCAAVSIRGWQAIPWPHAYTRTSRAGAHRKYLDRLGWEKFDPAGSLEGLARQTGTRLGVPMTVGLEVHDLGGG